MQSSLHLNLLFSCFFPQLINQLVLLVLLTSIILFSTYSASILLHHGCAVWYTTKNRSCRFFGEYFSPVTIHHHHRKTWESNYKLTGHELRRMLFRLVISVQSFGFLPITTLRMQPLKLSLVPSVPLGAPSGNMRKELKLNVNVKTKWHLKALLHITPSLK